MRIHEIIDTIPADQAYVYICHAPDGHCRVLAQNGGVYDSPEIEDPRNLSPAIGMLFDSHWRGANATEIAAHPWNGPRVMRSSWTDAEKEHLRIVSVDEARRLSTMVDELGPVVGPVVGRQPGEQPAQVFTPPWNDTSFPPPGEREQSSTYTPPGARPDVEG